jgi:hypothetical protein
MAPKRLLKRHVKVVAAGQAAVIGAKRGKHAGVVIGAEDALDNRVAAVVEREAGHEINEGDIRPARHIALAQDVPAEIVLPNDRQVSLVVRARISAAVVLLPEAKLPRTMMSFVDSVPVQGTRTR